MKRIIVSFATGLALVLATLALLPGGTHSGSAAGAIIYVNWAAAGYNEGGDWLNAYTSLQDALAEAESGDEIWVAKGVYYPDEGLSQINNAPTATFRLENGVALYGGFDPDNGADTFAERDWKTYPTIISGDLEGDDTNEGGIVVDTDDIAGINAYHVVMSQDVAETARLDGFVITAGNANGTDIHRYGGGIYNYNGSPTLTNITISGNYAIADGGGMINNANSNPVLTQVTFNNNSAEVYGGGMINYHSNPALIDVTFNSNSAVVGGGLHNRDESNPTLTSVTFNSNHANDNGGGMCNENSNPTLINITFDGNHAVGDGGGMYNWTSRTIMVNIAFSNNEASVGGGMNNQFSVFTMTNVTFAGNYASEDGGAIYNNYTTVSLANSILWGNQASIGGPEIYNEAESAVYATYSNIAGGILIGEGNISVDPLFADPAGRNYRIGANSPVMDAGSNLNITASTDLAGQPRIVDGNQDGSDMVDMGAYEFQTRIYVDQAAPGPQHNGSSWANAYTRLQDALENAAFGSEIWAARGVYYPDDGLAQTNNDPAASFQLTKGVAIYGGFDPAGGADTFAERDWETYPTILSGDIDHETLPDITQGDIVTHTDNIRGGNAYHVVMSQNVTETARLDGFVVTAGNARDGVGPFNGAGMHNLWSSPTLENVIFRGNLAEHWGGGMYNDENSKPTLINVIFDSNRADSEANVSGNGGGMFNYTSHPMLIRVAFINNHARYSGGGMCNHSESAPTLTNVLFSGNSAADGGGMYNGVESHPTLLNVTFGGNQASSRGGSIYNTGSDVILTNAILWGNQAGYEAPEIYNDEFSRVSATYSDIGDGGLPGDGNLFIDPQFVAPATGNYHLAPDSPIIDRGDNDSIPAGITTDLDNNQRIVDGNTDTNAVVDMGAYEIQVYHLAVVLAGSGSGSVGSSPAGIACPGDCSQELLDGSTITLTAMTPETSTFTAWSGACTGSELTCQITLNANESVTATFTILAPENLIYLPLVRR